MSSFSFLLFLFVVLIAAECSSLTPKNSEKFGCSEDETACLLGCCPLPNAVCCADGYECCPHGSTCIPIIGICVGVHAANLTLYTQATEKVDTVSASAEISWCPSGTTQCGAGCCPLPSAVCCSDGVHCCPGGYSCDYSRGGCVRRGMYSPFLDKVSYSQATEKVDTVSAESEISWCPSGTTQCGAGCCPLPSAVCCSDGVHCCPGGYSCDYSRGGCVRKGMYSPFLDKVMY